MTDAGAAGQAAPAPYYVVFDVDVDLHALRDEVSYARMAGVEGLPSVPA